MQLTIYQFLYLLMDVLGLIIVYQLIRTLIRGYTYNKKVEVLGYITFYIVNSIFYLIVRIPLLLLFTTVVSLFLLTLNYESPTQRKAFAALMTGIILFMTEITVVLFIGAPLDSIVEVTGSTIFYFGLIKALQFLVLLFLKHFYKGKYIDIKPDFNDVPLFWAVLTGLLVAAAATGFSFVHMPIRLVILIALMLGCLTVYTVYRLYMQEEEKKQQRKFLLLEGNSYIKQSQLLMASTDAVRDMKKELNNHLKVLKDMILEDQTENTLEYINRHTTGESRPPFYVNTGNPVIDSLLNIKVYEAKTKGIELVPRICIPRNLGMDAADAISLLENLIDAASEEVQKFEDKKIILLSHFDKGHMLVKTTHMYDGIVPEDNENNPCYYSQARMDSIMVTVNEYYGMVHCGLQNNKLDFGVLLCIDG